MKNLSTKEGPSSTRHASAFYGYCETTYRTSNDLSGLRIEDDHRNIARSKTRAVFNRRISFASIEFLLNGYSALNFVFINTRPAWLRNHIERQHGRIMQILALSVMMGILSVSPEICMLIPPAVQSISPPPRFQAIDDEKTVEIIILIYFKRAKELSIFQTDNKRCSSSFFICLYVEVSTKSLINPPPPHDWI